MPASLNDILTTAQNLVQQVSGVSQTLLKIIGLTTSPTVDADTLITTGLGTLVNVSVVEAGSTQGYVHNAATVALATPANALFAIPITNVGVLPAGLQYDAGLVVVVGTDMEVNLTYTQIVVPT